MFLGEHEHTLDGKGRLVLPVRFREQLASGLVFAPSLDPCIDVYPTAAFDERVEELRSWPREDPRTRRYLHLIVGRAHPDTPDAQGRVTVPARLREYAGLDRDLMVVGVDEKVQIWDRAAWEAYRRRIEAEFPELDRSALTPAGSA